MSELGVAPDQVIAGKYQLVKLLGKGGMGSVWRAQHLTLASEVAVKIIKPEIAKNNGNAVARFLREAKAAAMLRSPHVVQVLDHGHDGDTAFIVMELLEGESLQERLSRRGALTPELCATVITHVSRAIGKAHEVGIVHRDLEPDNIFLVQNEDEIVAKVLDFGIAKTSLMALNETNSPDTQTGAVLGTPYYMSPEQATGQKEVDARSDLWALGVIAFECLIGARPYQSDSLGELVLQICARPAPVPSEHGDVPEGFDAWFLRSQQRDREERFQTAREMAAALKEVLARPAQATSKGPSTRAAPMAPLSATDLTGHDTAHDDTMASDPGMAGGKSTTSSSGESSTSKSASIAGAARAVTADPGGTVESAGTRTLDPVSSAPAPKRSPLVMVIAALGVLLLGGVAATRLLHSEPQAASPNTTTTTPSATPTSTSIATPSSTTTAAATVNATSAAGAAASRASSASAVVTPPAPALAKSRPTADPAAKHPPPVSDDPLGIGK